MHRPALLPAGFGPSLPRPTFVSCPHVNKGLPSSHYPGLLPAPTALRCPSCLCSVPGCSQPDAPAPTPSPQPLPRILLGAASLWTSVEGSFPAPGRPPGLPSARAWALASSQAPLSSRAASPCPSPSGAGSSPSKWRRGFLARAGRGAPPGAGSPRLGRAPAAGVGEGVERGAGGLRRGLASRGRARLACCPQWATQAHGCGRHMGGGRRLRRTEGGCVGAAVLAGRGLRARPQGLPLRAAVLRRWVRLRGVVAREGAPVSAEIWHLGREGGGAQPRCSPAPLSAPETPEEEGRARSRRPHLFPLWRRGWGGGRAGLGSGLGRRHQAVGSQDAGGGWEVLRAGLRAFSKWGSSPWLADPFLRL